MIVLGFVLSASSPTDTLARSHRSGRAVRKASHSAARKRHAKFSSKNHRTPHRTLTDSEKSEIIAQIKTVANTEVLTDSSLTIDSAQIADMAQAAKEEREEDNIEVSIDKFFADRSVDVDAIDPELQKDRLTDFTLATDNKVSSTRSDIMQHIIDWVGTRYVFGGVGRDGIDCSAFTREVFRTSFNVELPRTANMQAGLGSKVGKDDLKFGDLVFFKTARYAPITHVGIYVGEGLFANAQSSRGVTVASLESDYWSRRYLFAKRLFTNTGIAQAAPQPDNTSELASNSAPVVPAN